MRSQDNYHFYLESRALFARAPAPLADNYRFYLESRALFARAPAPLADNYYFYLFARAPGSLADNDYSLAPVSCSASTALRFARSVSR